jgi:hypothetical protein
MARRSKRPVPPTGYVLYDGPSLLDGERIVCIATVHSSNGKTGDMLQTWIMRADKDPLAASRDGTDCSNCGTCPSRGRATGAASGIAAERACYVDLGRAPLNIWRTWQRGRYPSACGHALTSAVGRGRKVRLGAYGDMSAVPGYVATSLISEASGHTAYSHQSGSDKSSFDAAIYMVSADSLAEAEAAWERGARTFRVVSDESEAVPGREIVCVNHTRGVQCLDCLLCDGAGRHGQAKSIVIPVHGAGAKHWNGGTMTGGAL